MAQAQKSMGVVAIEGWSDSPTPDVTRLLEKLKQRFHQHGYIKASRPGLRLSELDELVRRGRHHYSHGDQKKAMPFLRDAIEQLRAPPVVPDEGPELRAKQMEALIIASLSSTRLGDKKPRGCSWKCWNAVFPATPFPSTILAVNQFGFAPVSLRAWRGASADNCLF